MSTAALRLPSLTGMHRYTILKVLGDGTYGDVSLGLNKETGEKVAIKR